MAGEGDDLYVYTPRHPHVGTNVKSSPEGAFYMVGDIDAARKKG